MQVLVFVIVPPPPLTDGRFAVLLAGLGRGNASAGVTGVLARHDGRCVAVIEGDEGDVADRFRQICVEPRYGVVRELCRETVQHRLFPGWAAAHQQADPLLHSAEDVVAVLTTPLDAAPELSARRGRALLAWFRAHPRAPLSAQHHTDGTSPRVRIVNATIEALHETGVEDCSVGLVADVASIRVDDLRALFPTGAELTGATIQRWAGALSMPLWPLTAELGVVAYLRALVRAQAEHPDLMRLVASTLSASTSRTQSSGELFRTMYSGFKRTVRTALEDDIRLGREPAALDPDEGAQQLLALYDGLRLQALLEPGLDIADAFDRAVAGVRAGWSERRGSAAPDDPFDWHTTVPAGPGALPPTTGGRP